MSHLRNIFLDPSRAAALESRIRDLEVYAGFDRQRIREGDTSSLSLAQDAFTLDTFSITVEVPEDAFVAVNGGAQFDLTYAANSPNCYVYGYLEETTDPTDPFYSPGRQVMNHYRGQPSGAPYQELSGGPVRRLNPLAALGNAGWASAYVYRPTPGQRTYRLRYYKGGSGTGAAVDRWLTAEVV